MPNDYRNDHVRTALVEWAHDSGQPTLEAYFDGLGNDETAVLRAAARQYLGYTFEPRYKLTFISLSEDSMEWFRNRADREAPKYPDLNKHGRAKVNPIGWQSYILPVDFYVDNRPPDLVMAGLLCDDVKRGGDPRDNHSSTILDKRHELLLCDIAEHFGMSRILNRNKISFARIFNQLLEAIGQEYIQLTEDE